MDGIVKRVAVAVLLLALLGVASCGDDPSPAVPAQPPDAALDGVRDPATQEPARDAPPTPVPKKPVPKAPPPPPNSAGARGSVAGRAKQPWLAQLRSHDPSIRRAGIDSMRDADDPSEQAVRASVMQLNGGDEASDLAPAMSLKPELGFLLVADRLGYASIQLRRRMCASMGALPAGDSYASVLLLVHAMLDGDDLVRAAARRSLERLAPTLVGIAQPPETPRRLDTTAIVAALRGDPTWPRTMMALVTYLPIFASRLGGRDDWASATLRFAAAIVASRPHPEKSDEAWLRRLWIDLPTGDAGEGEDRVELARMVVHALKWDAEEKMSETHGQEPTREIALWKAIRLGESARRVAPYTVTRVAHEATRAQTLWAVRRSSVYEASLEKDLRSIVLESGYSMSYRLRAASRLATFARLGAVRAFLVDQLAVSRRWRQALRALVLCHREDVEAVQADLDADALRERRPRHDQMYIRRMTKMLNYTEAERVWEILGGDDTDLIAHLDRWADPSMGK